MTPRPKNPTKTRHIRVPIELDQWVQRQANQSERTYNGQVVHLLKQLKALADAAERKEGQ